MCLLLMLFLTYVIHKKYQSGNLLVSYFILYVSQIHGVHPKN